MNYEDFMGPNDQEFQNMVNGFYKKSDKEPRPEFTPMPPITNDQTIDFIRSKATEELEKIRQSFLTFQEEIADLAIYPFLFHQIEEFAEACMDISEIFDNNFDVDKMSSESKAKFNEIQKVRTKMLSVLWQKYKNQMN